MNDFAPQPVIVRRAEQGIVPRGAAHPLSHKSRAWKRAGAVAAAGVFFGLGAAISFETATPSAQSAQRWVRADDNNSQLASLSALSTTSTPVAGVVNGTVDSSSADPAEVERLKVRNRRLEALVQVLRQRKRVAKRGSNLASRN